MLLTLTTQDFLRNIFGFVPFGILFATIILRKYTIGYLLTFIVVTLAGGLLSFTIEFLQLFLPTRISGITDIFGNIAGSGLGVLVAYLLNRTYLYR